jgi:hypothetical protein
VPRIDDPRFSDWDEHGELPELASRSTDRGSAISETVGAGHGKTARRQNLVKPDAEWIALVTGILELPIAFFPAVQMALVQGRWRKAKNPKAYIQKVARREARKTLAAFPRRPAISLSHASKVQICLVAARRT